MGFMHVTNYKRKIMEKTKTLLLLKGVDLVHKYLYLMLQCACTILIFMYYFSKGNNKF